MSEKITPRETAVSSTGENKVGSMLQREFEIQETKQLHLLQELLTEFYSTDHLSNYVFT
jgi:hypothetical protein